jgi:hypothetical protein
MKLITRTHSYTIHSSRSQVAPIRQLRTVAEHWSTPEFAEHDDATSPRRFGQAFAPGVWLFVYNAAAL